MTTSNPPDESLIPPNAFDFLPDLHNLLQRVYSDEIDPKDVAHESNQIRLKIAKARNLVAVLPDVDKSLEEQQADIKALQERIAKQKQMLVEMGNLEVVKKATRSGKMEVDI
ncbi:RNA polymerase II transcription mediator complex subunit 9-domain-containing protein [Trichophaea hybrida]|nr:RNA polymerase II transcription mediator complex subunit 9-domain-containing protein [Trichophaea hybrida]